MARQVLENGVVLPAEYSDDWYDDMTSNLTKLDDVIGSDSEKLSSADVGAAALSNNYNDLDNLPTIPTVNDATLTIQKNGVDVQTFTANASSNVTCNITVPTKTSDLINDSNFVDTSNSAVSSGITSSKVTDYDTHIVDTDIHVTTADKNKWNNNTYVFRYSSTALVASSTNANSLLDNTDNLKVGDKVIDSSGVLFSITAIDTQNSTFTIGTALIDLANDSDVVHKSGNETVGGEKTFNGLNIISYGTQYKGARNAYILPEFAAGYSGLSITTMGFAQALKIGNFVLDANNKPTLDTSKAYIQISTGESNGVNACLLESRNSTSSSLGTSSNKWSKIYGTEYYYGSNNVEFSTKFVTTDTAQTIDGNKTFTEYITSDGSTTGDEYSNNAKTNLWLMSNRDMEEVSGVLFDTYRQNTAQGTGIHILGISIKENSVRYEGCRFGWYWDNDLNGYTFDLKPTTQGVNQAVKHNLGTSTDKWDTINGLNPGSLSMPDLSNGVDISSYLDTSQSSSNYYTPPVNGWISIKGRSGANTGIAIIQGDFAQSSYSLIDFNSTDKITSCTLPVKAGVQVEIWLKSVTTLDFAKFYPCLGNV